jgi:hypothetical protein
MFFKVLYENSASTFSATLKVEAACVPETLVYEYFMTLQQKRNLSQNIRGIIVARRIQQNKFCTEGTKLLSVPVKTLVAMATWQPQSVHPWSTICLGILGFIFPF